MSELSREWLDHQADQIEDLLASHKLDAYVTRVQISPRWVRYILKLEMGTRISSIENLSEELAMTLGAANIRITRSGGALAIETPLDDPEPVYLLALIQSIPALPLATAVLGLSLEGEPFTLKLTAPEVTHVLVAGMTGSGKTELLRSMLLSLALYNRQANLQIALMDPKRRGFSPLDGVPHLMAPVATTTREIVDVLEELVAEMERRDREDAPPIPRIVVAVDEVSDLLTTGGREVEQHLVRLAQRGREAGFHLICSTQRPTADAIPSAIKANLPCRLTGKVATAQESVTATGIGGANAEMLVGSGDFLAVIGGKITRFQSAYAPREDIRYIIEHLRNTSGTNTSPEDDWN